jgi:hypothetical protein
VNVMRLREPLRGAVDEEVVVVDDEVVPVEA